MNSRNPTSNIVVFLGWGQIVCLLLAAIPTVCFAAPDETELGKTLAALPPLQKTHYSWAVPGELLRDENNKVLLEYIRITHAISINDWVTRKQIHVAVSACRQVNRSGLEPPASIAINYSPWHRVFPKDAPPTDTGPSQTAEVKRFRNCMIRIRDWIAIANRNKSTGITVTAIIFDTERFHVQPGNQDWNQAIRKKYDIFYDLGKELFPEARIEWYGRGIMPAGTSSGWQASKYFPFSEKADSFSCSLYRLPEIGQMRETFKRTLDLAKRKGGNEVTPWVALASGYRRKTTKFQEWDPNWDYDLIYSWQLGAELNHPWFAKREERFAPYYAARVVVFYPSPFNKNSPAWAKHFVAYVKGAHQIKDLPE